MWGGKNLKNHNSFNRLFNSPAINRKAHIIEDNHIFWQLSQVVNANVVIESIESNLSFRI